MRRLLVTVAYGQWRRDLAVRADVPIADLLGPLAEALGVGRGRPGGDPGRGLGLAPLCGPPLPLERSLVACAVGHGAVLVLVRPPDAPSRAKVPGTPRAADPPGSGP
jgi:hypothetical protein